jgi:putative ABC transport system permease protein
LEFLLVGMQVALAVILIEGAGLLVRSFQELGRVSPGFDPQHVLTICISSTFAEAGGNAAKQRTNRILDSLRSMPGIEVASTATSLPGVPDEYQIELKATEGRAETEPGVSETKILAQGRWVDPEYFSVLHIPILAGELCRDKPDVLAAMMIAFNRYLKGPAAIGRHLVQPANPYSRSAEIRGIVGDVRETGLDREPPPTAHFCAGAMQPFTVFLIKARGEPGSLAGTVRRKIHEVEPLRSVYDLTSLTSHISDAYAENRLRMILLAFFALTAFALASVGLYGTLSYAVNVRRCEVAVRMALGALRAQVARQFLAQGFAITMLGCMAGLAFAIAFARTLSSMLYGVSATDAITRGGGHGHHAGGPGALFAAIRAARLERMQALREE